MQEAARCETRPQTADQFIGTATLLRPDGCRVPLFGLVIVNRHECRLAAHGQAHILRGQIDVDLLAERVQRIPRFIRERQGDARGLTHPRHGHLEIERGVCKARDAAADRRGRAEMRRGSHGDMSLAAEQAGGRVHADPASAGDIDLRPGMQVREILGRALRPFQRVDIGGELHQIAGDKAGRKTEMPQDLHHEPA